jgi:hypothetical protein
VLRADRCRSRGVNTTLLPRWEIPEHVNAILAGHSWEEGEAQDQQVLFHRVVEVACSLILRGYDAAEAEEFLSTHTPVDRQGRAREAILWEELTTRGRHFKSATRILTRAWDYAQERIDGGYIPNGDQPRYASALAEMWKRAVKRERVQLTKTEADAFDWFVGQMIERGYLDITCPARALAQVIGTTPRGAWKVLKRLQDKRVLICRDRGVGVRAQGLAAIYCLSPEVEQAPVRARSRPTRSSGSRRESTGGRPGAVKGRHSYGSTHTVSQRKPQVNPQKRPSSGAQTGTPINIPEECPQYQFP